MVPDRVTSMDSGLKLSVKTFEMNPDDGEEWRRIPTPEGVELALSLWFGALGRTIGTLTCFEGVHGRLIVTCCWMLQRSCYIQVDRGSERGHHDTSTSNK